jgi:hypothetical protein
MKAWEEDGNKLQQEVDKLWQILLAAGTDPEAQNVTCVLDAFDECQEDDRGRLVTMMSKFYVEFLPRVPQKGRPKFFVTSRPYTDIQHEFQDIKASLPAIRLRGEEENDQIH